MTILVYDLIGVFSEYGTRLLIRSLRCWDGLGSQPLSAVKCARRSKSVSGIVANKMILLIFGSR